MFCRYLEASAANADASRHGHYCRKEKLTSVPDLCLDSLAVHIDASRSKLNADSGFALEVELVACESGEYCVVSLWRLHAVIYMVRRYSRLLYAARKKGGG
jgi:hypothetical protein